MKGIRTRRDKEKGAAQRGRTHIFYIAPIVIYEISRHDNEARPPSFIEEEDELCGGVNERQTWRVGLRTNCDDDQKRRGIHILPK